MNTFLAASLFDSPWVILVVVLAAALSQWLMRRRLRDDAARRSVGDDAARESDASRPSQREMDLQEALRELLGGEPPPRAPRPPPIPSVVRDEQVSEGWLDEESLPPDSVRRDAPPATYEAAPSPAIPTVVPPPPRAAVARADTPRREAGPRQGRAARPFKQPGQTVGHPATVSHVQRRRRSRVGARAVALVRDARTVRTAFVASLVFGPPKAFESGRL